MKLASMELSGLSGHEAGRVLLEKLYREQTGQQMPSIAVTDRGKPYFPDSDLHFSISHTPKRVFCLLSDHPVGLDAEQMGRKIDLKLAEKILSPTEKSRFDAATDKQATLLKFWVLKEAYAKLAGRGWGSYLYETNFTPADVKEIDGHYVAVLEEK
jgi:4'-phosphopantetheinyl transferase